MHICRRRPQPSTRATEAQPLAPHRMARSPGSDDAIRRSTCRALLSSHLGQGPTFDGLKCREDELQLNPFVLQVAPCRLYVFEPIAPKDLELRTQLHRGTKGGCPA